MTSIHINNLTKSFGETIAVNNVSLTIESGELFFLLGPSGCGKTTLLRMLAGFIEPTNGAIMFGERDVTHLPPHKRNTGMVFQSYALWPHMTVLQNVSYGLKLRKLASNVQEKKAKEALSVVQMEHLAHRKPNELSGGQQQRVALARSIVVEPDVLLLDEPLSNLDAKLRLEMRTEIRRICTTLGITTVYVTHDQKEALSIADRMAVLKNGHVQQIGSPQEVYNQPCSSFVASFIGETNFIEAKSEGNLLTTAVGLLESTHSSTSTDVTVSIRPESFSLNSPPSSPNTFSGTCIQSIYLGESAQHKFKTEGGNIIAVTEMNPKHRVEVGQTTTISVAPADVFPITKS